MSDLICNNHNMLLLLSRFGISLGFSNSTIDEVCKRHDLDTNTFLAIVNLLNGESYELDTDISLTTMINYLKNSHSYYLNFRLPVIRKKLVEAIGQDAKNIEMGVLITRYFDEYTEELRKHMEYEEKNVFPYIVALDSNISTGDYSIDIFSENHHDIDSKLSELKDIIIKYCPIDSSNLLISALYDIFVCAKDSLAHNMVEDKILIPYIKKMEGKRL